MITILLIIPVTNTGGITSWGQKYISTFPDDDFKFHIVAQDPHRPPHCNIWNRIISGAAALVRSFRNVRKVLLLHNVDIMHTTTSGSIGGLRDWLLGKYCRFYGVKTIMHCHYGCIPQVLHTRGIVRWITLKAMSQYDQIWVLDSSSYQALRSHKNIHSVIKLTPNNINVSEEIKVVPKTYTNVAFIGNLIPTKGLYELVQAVVLANEKIVLHIVGGGAPDVVAHIQNLADNTWGKRVKYYGRMTNTDAVDFMQKMDILALPTYYPPEAFPISILEAMSLGKLIISTHRAAIPDMLTMLDGTMCGILVPEKSVDALIDALHWCLNNPLQADAICLKAYEKVWNTYRSEVIYNLYIKCYRELLC